MWFLSGSHLGRRGKFGDTKATLNDVDPKIKNTRRFHAKANQDHGAQTAELPKKKKSHRGRRSAEGDVASGSSTQAEEEVQTRVVVRPCRDQTGRTAPVTDQERALWTRLVPQLAFCSALARPWPPAGGTCGFCPSPEKDAPWLGRLPWPQGSPALSFGSRYRREPPSQCWTCTCECELCSGRAAWK